MEKVKARLVAEARGRANIPSINSKNREKSQPNSRFFENG